MRLILSNRENLGKAFRGTDLPERASVGAIGDLPRGYAVLGYASLDREPIAPVLLIVKDEELRETLAWITTYAPHVRPLTASCRALSLSDWTKLQRVIGGQARTPLVSPWSGLVLAECYAQTRGRASLNRIPLAAAFSCLSFTIGRLTHLWSSADCFSDLAARVVEDHRRLLPNRRIFGPGTLLPVWTSLWALQGISPYAKDESTFIGVLKDVAAGAPIGRAIRLHIADRLPSLVSRMFDADLSPEDRVRNFDLLVGSQVDNVEPASLREFLIGAAASQISAGGLSHIELLGEHVEKFPGALLWYGTIAGIAKELHWSAEFGGLARGIEKALIRPFEWERMPDCDIALSELNLDEAPNGTFDFRHLRGASNRFIEVELCPGVNAVVPISEGSSATVPSSVAPSQPSLALRPPPKLDDAWTVVNEIESRLFQLKALLSDMGAESAREYGSDPKRSQAKPRKRSTRAPWQSRSS